MRTVNKPRCRLTRILAQGVAWGWRAKQKAERISRLAMLRLQQQVRAQTEELTETRRLLQLQKVETNQALTQLKLQGSRHNLQ